MIGFQLQYTFLFRQGRSKEDGPPPPPFYAPVFSTQCAYLHQRTFLWVHLDGETGHERRPYNYLSCLLLNQVHRQGKLKYFGMSHTLVFGLKFKTNAPVGRKIFKN